MRKDTKITIVEEEFCPSDYEEREAEICRLIAQLMYERIIAEEAEIMLDKD